MTFLSRQSIKKLCEEHNVISDYDDKRLKHSAYELRIHGKYVLSSKNGSNEQDLKEGQSFKIPPGQIALLFTAEKVHIPADHIGFISIKFSQKRRGLLNISGFHVDPGWHGPIQFSVYNASPQTIHLRCGEPLFMLWLAKLDEASNTPYPSPEGGSNQNFSSEDLLAIDGSLASPQALLDALKSVEERLRKVEESHKRYGWLARRTVLMVIGAICGAIGTVAIGMIVRTSDHSAPPPPPPISAVAPVPTPPQVPPPIIPRPAQGTPPP